MISDISAGEHKFLVLNSHSDVSVRGQVGCVAEIIRIEQLEDGRSNILTVGRERARVIECFGDKPYLMARIKFLADLEMDATSGVVEELKDNLSTLSKLTSKLYGRDVNEILLADLDPEELSFIVAGLIVNDPTEQQKMLELEETAERIKLLEERLQAMSKKMAAIAAIEDAFADEP